MTVITEPARKTPVIHNTDVLMVGSGPGGLAVSLTFDMVGADPVAFASVRGAPQSMAMGQATGMAAAMALAEQLRVQDVRGDALAENLAREVFAGIAGRKRGGMQELGLEEF